MRNYANRAEANTYLYLSKYRAGRYSLYIDSASHTYEYWYRDCLNDTCLVLKNPAAVPDSLIFATRARLQKVADSLGGIIGTKLQNTLATGKIWAGDLSGNAAQVTPGGVLTMTSGGSYAYANNSVTYSKIQQIPGQTVIGNPDGSTGNSRALYLKYGFIFDNDSTKIDTTTLKTVFGASSYSFENGLTNSSGTVKLGGLLTENTTIDGDGLWFLKMPALADAFIESYDTLDIKGATTIIQSSNAAPNSVAIKTGAATTRLKIDNDGVITLPTLALTGLDTTTNKVQVFNTSTKAISYMNWPSTGGSGGITALTGDVAATGPGSVAATLATVNSSPGTYLNPVVTVNGKGLSTAISSACLWPVENSATWPIYRRAKWYALNDFTAQGGISLALNGTNIDITGGASNYGVYATIPSFGGMTAMAKWSDTIRYKIVSSGTGLAIGLNSQSNSNTAHDVVAFFQNGGSSSNVYVSNASSNTVLATSGAVVSYSVGDSIELTGTFDQYNTTFIASAKNLTTGAASVSVTYTYPSPSSAVYPNTGNMAVYHMGGTQRIYYMSFNGVDTRNPLLTIQVDSKGQGYYATTYSTGFVSQLRGNSNYATTIARGGEGDRTDMTLASWGEILRQNGKYLLMAGIARNDLGGGVSLAQVEKNYDTVYSRSIAAGITPIFMMFPEGSTSGQAANLKLLDTYLRTTFPANYIAAWDTLSSNGNTIIPAYSNSDSIHLSQLGNDAVYRAVIASPLIQACNNRTFQTYQNDSYITNAGNSASLTVPLVQDAARKNDSTLTINYTGGGAKDITLRFGTSSTSWENVLDNSSTLTHNHTISGGSNEFIWNNTLIEIGATSFLIPTSDAVSDIGFPSNRFNHLFGHQLITNYSVFGNYTNWQAQQGNDATKVLAIVPIDTDTTKNAIELWNPNATAIGQFKVTSDGRVAIKADSVGTATGGCLFRDFATGLIKLAPCGSGGGSDTLKVVNAGSGMQAVFVLPTDTLASKTVVGVNSISLTTLPDSTLQWKLVNDTAIGTAANYYYGTNAAGRLGYYSITGSLYTFNNGLTNTSGTVGLGGTLLASSTVISGSGVGTALQIGTGVDIDAVLLAPKMVQTSSANAFGNWNAITSGSSSTVASTGYSNVVFNPGSLIASYTLTLPATPVDGHMIWIHAGGTIAGGATVVTAFTVSPNSGQTIMESVAPTTLIGGDCFIYKYYSAGNRWYREK